jgi:hypothetical protein
MRKDMDHSNRLTDFNLVLGLKHGVLFPQLKTIFGLWFIAVKW